MQLSPRLTAVAEMIPKNCRLADVGADRGEISYAPLEKELVSHIILCDISPNSLKRAETLFAPSPFLAKAEFRVGSGFTVLCPKEVDCAILAGMGGETIVGIFAEAPQVTASLSTIVVQAMGNSHAVRRYFSEHHFNITDEAMVYEDGHFYTIIKGEAGEMTLTDRELYFGKILLQKKDPLLKKRIAKEKGECCTILKMLQEKNRGEIRQKELQDRITFYEKTEEEIL